MKKVFWSIGFAVVFIIIGILVDRFYLKPKPIVIDEKDIPEEIVPVEVKPSKVVDEEVYLEALSNSVQLKEEINDLENAIVYLKEKNKVVKKAEQQPKNDPLEDEQPAKKDTTKIKMKASYFEERWTVNEDDKILIPMVKPYNNNWYVKVDTKVLSFTSAKQENITPFVRWKKHFEDFRLPKIEKQMYNKGVYGVLVGAATVGALLYENPYIAGGAIVMCADFTFDLGIGKFIFNLL